MFAFGQKDVYVNWVLQMGTFPTKDGFLFKYRRLSPRIGSSTLPEIAASFCWAGGAGKHNIIQPMSWDEPQEIVYVFFKCGKWEAGVLLFECCEVKKKWAKTYKNWRFRSSREMKWGFLNRCEKGPNKSNGYYICRLLWMTLITSLFLFIVACWQCMFLVPPLFHG